MYARILVPTDGSQLADRAVKEASTLARTIGATLTLFYAAPDYRMPAYFEGSTLRNYVTPEETPTLKVGLV